MINIILVFGWVIRYFTKTALLVWGLEAHILQWLFFLSVWFPILLFYWSCLTFWKETSSHDGSCLWWYPALHPLGGCSAFSVWPFHMTQNFHSPDVILHEQSIRWRIPLSANSSSSPYNLKQTSLKLYRRRQARKKLDWEKGLTRKDVDFDLISGSGSEVLKMLFFCPCLSLYPENPSCLHPNPVQIGSDTCNQRVLTAIGAYTVLTFNGTDWKKIYWTEL